METRSESKWFFFLLITSRDNNLKQHVYDSLQSRDLSLEIILITSNLERPSGGKGIDCADDRQDIRVAITLRLSLIY